MQTKRPAHFNTIYVQNMKTLLSLLLLVALPAFGQMSISKVDAAQATLGVKNIGPVPPETLVAHGLVDANGNVTVSGSVGGSQAILTPATTISFAPINGVMTFTDVPAQSQTINAVTANAVKGQTYRFVFTTSGTTSYTITFGTNFLSKGTLVTGTVTAITYSVLFVFDGINFDEVARSRDASALFALVDATPIALGTAEGLTVYTLTPAQGETINAAVVPKAGDKITLEVVTSGTSSFTLTFGTGFKSTGTLATGTSSAKIFTVNWISDGTNYVEQSRTAAQ